MTGTMFAPLILAVSPPAGASISVAAGSLAGAVVTSGQPAETGDANLPADAETTEIVITGSRIRRLANQGATPVLTLDEGSISTSGTTNLTDFLADYPALVGSSTSADNSGDDAAIGSTGLNLLNLRNLGINRTLVLVNAGRHVPALPGSQAVDINTIPRDLIERIEILTGGASAIYGSDGVSGVVNFILKRDFEGVSARAQAGASEFGDAGQRFASVTAGKNFAAGRGNLALAYEYGHEDRLETRDRRRLRGAARVGFYRNPADTEAGANSNDGIPDFIPQADIRFFDTAREGGIDIDFDGFPDFIGANAIPFEPGTFVPDFYQRGGNATLVSDYGNDLAPTINRHIINFLSHFQIAPALTVFAEGKYAATRSFSLNQPTFDYFLFINEENPFIPAAVRERIIPGLGSQFFRGDGVLVTRDNFDLGQRGEKVDRATHRGVLGVRGDLSDQLGYELSYTSGRTRVTSNYLNDILDDRFFAAIDVVTDPATGQPTCRANIDPAWSPDQAFIALFPVRDVRERTTFNPGQCVPLNLFGEGLNPAAALEFIRVDTRDRSRVDQQVLNGLISGDAGDWLRLPGGSPAFAVGAEYRREKSTFRPDALAAQGLTFTNALSTDAGRFSVAEVFGEVRLPLLKGKRFAERLDAGGAIRLSDYSTVGRATTWKVDGSYAPFAAVAFNATYSKAVRAPNIGELFAGRSQTFEFITDPCNSNEVQNGSPARAANCAQLLSSLGVGDPSAFRDPRATNISGFRGGNPDLEAEKARTWTGGLVLQPRLLPGLSVRADWYDIKVNNAVNLVEPEQLAQLCVDQPKLQNIFCNSIVRQQGGANAGLITSFSVGPQNVSRFATAGLDLNLKYKLPGTRLGSFVVNLVGNYLDKLQFTGTPGASVTNSRREARAPRFQANADLAWRYERFTINYGVSWFDKTLRFSNQEARANPDISALEYLYHKARWVHDLYGSADVSETLQFYGGLNNFAGQRPSLGADSYPVSSVGRFFFAGARVRLP